MLELLTLYMGFGLGMFVLYFITCAAIVVYWIIKKGFERVIPAMDELGNDIDAFGIDNATVTAEWYKIILFWPYGTYNTWLAITTINDYLRAC